MQVNKRVWAWNKDYTPWKINGEPKNGALEDAFPSQ